MDALKKREDSLDALRGIAAMMVVIAHTTIAGLYKVEPLWSELKWTPLKIFWSGHQAVVLFFVLSGFALVRMWQSIKNNRYDAYVVSRVVRLFPPYICSVLLALLVYTVVGGYVEWDKGWMNIPKPTFNLPVIADHILMVGRFDTSEINPPIWSIVYEMRISLVFPLIYFLVSRLTWFSVVCFVAASLFVGWVMLGYVQVSPFQADTLLTIHYSTFFALGAFIAFEQSKVSSVFGKFQSSCRGLLWVAGAILYAYPFDNSWNLGERVFGDLAIGLGSGLIVCLAITTNSIFLVRVGAFLGRISYSLYLNHMLVLNLSLLFLYRSFGAPVVWASTVIGALVLSYVMCRVVEGPSIALSRSLRRMMLLRHERQLD